jgi:hypothetical protein
VLLYSSYSTSIAIGRSSAAFRLSRPRRDATTGRDGRTRGGDARTRRDAAGGRPPGEEEPRSKAARHLVRRSNAARTPGRGAARSARRADATCVFASDKTEPRGGKQAFFWKRRGRAPGRWTDDRKRLR